MQVRQAVVLVGGRGTRLGKITADTPKPLLEIGPDLRFLDLLLGNLARHGVSDVILLAGHLGERVTELYHHRHIGGARVQVVREPEARGTAGALREAEALLDETFLMLNGDSLFDINYLRLAAKLGPNDIAALALRKVDDPSRYATVKVVGDRIESFLEKDPASRDPAPISGGVYFMRRDILTLVDRMPCSLEVDIFPRLAADRRLAGAVFDGYFIDIGIPDSLAQAQRELPALARRRAVLFDRDGTLNEDPGYVHRPEDLRLRAGAAEAIRYVNDQGWLAIVVTNQAGVARGLYDVEAAQRFHAAMQSELARHGAHIDAFYLCPFHGEGAVPAFAVEDHPDRKPNPGMIRRAMLEWSIDAKGAVLIGDRPSDTEAAARAGIAGVLINESDDLLAVVKKAMAAAPRPAVASVSIDADIRACAAAGKAWLFDHALPLWFDRGFDRTAACFHERLDLNGAPRAELPRRLRVQARQTFVYAQALKLGWPGPAREAVEAGAKVLLERGMAPDGAPVHLMSPAGEPIDFRHDLYDVAFLVFALAHAGGALKRSDCLAAADKVFTWAETNWTRPEGGFHEGAITPCPPYRQNPHMHMLEAALALHEASGDEKHLHRANGIAALMRDKLFSRIDRALPEYFDVNWTPLPGDEGRITEPGHQFEWSWLLDRWRRAGGGDLSHISEALRIHGEVYGVNADGIVFDEVWADGAPRTRSSRLWPHTERIKANAARYKRSRDPHAGRAIVQAYGVLMRYCDTPTPGVWRDRLQADGRFIEEAAPASSFYHITLALAELCALADAL